MTSQGLLFSEPSIAETGVWCELSTGIDPAEWASLCRFIGSRSPGAFDAIVEMVKGRENSEVVSAGVDRMVGVPLVSIGASEIGGSCSGGWRRNPMIWTSMPNI